MDARTAIAEQGRLLQKRVEWLQKMLERQSQAVLNSQAMVEHYSQELTAANLAIDSLRAEYKQLGMGNGNE